MIFLFIFILIWLIAIIIKKKLIIRFDTFFKKGFRKTDDKYGIFCFTGKQGSGKTLSSISFILDTCKKENKKVITNVKSFANNYKDICIYEFDFMKIIDLFNNGTYTKDYIIFYDELFTLLKKGKLDEKILSFISQLRKREIYLITTVQEWLEINVTFRRYCRFYIECEMKNLFGLFAISINSVHDGYNMKWNNDINDFESPIISTTIKKCSLDLVNSYDTFEVIKNNFSKLGRVIRPLAT